MIYTTKKYRTTVACKFCGQPGLQWAATAAGYRLFDVRPNGDGTVSLIAESQHVCAPVSAAAGKVATAAELAELASTVTASSTLMPTIADLVSMPMVTVTVAAQRAGKLLGVTAPWHDALRGLWAAGARRILIAGPPGTGKTTTALQVLDTQFRVTMTEGSGVEDLLGCFQLSKEKDEDKTACTVWANGPVPNAMLAGKGILIDEIDKMPPEIQSLMYAVMDDRPEIMLPTGEMVAGAKGYGVIATTNANIAVLPEAIIDRFDAALVAVSPHPESIAHLPAAERGAVVNYFKSVSAAQWQWAGKPTVRRMRSYVALKSAGTLTAELAALAVFGKSAEEIMSALTTSGRDVLAVATERGF